MKVIASDFDNTLFVKDEDNMKKNIEAVDNFINEGNIFIIITGRSFTNIKKVLNEKQIRYSYLVCQDGANIFNNEDECIKSNYFDKTKAENIEKYLIENNINYSFESAFNDNDILDNAVKITITLDESDNAKEIVSKIKEKESIYAYVSSKHINIIDDYVNKSSALKFLKDNDYISNNITVIGDDVNDYEMLKDFDGVIMKKHDPILNSLNKNEIESVNEYLNQL